MVGLKYGEAGSETKLYTRENSECREGAGDAKGFLEVAPKITSNVQAAPGQPSVAHFTHKPEGKTPSPPRGQRLCPPGPSLRAVVGVLCAREPPGQPLHQLMPRPRPAG